MNSWTFRILTNMSFAPAGPPPPAARAWPFFMKNRPETKFYILAQDYVWGHDSAGVFKKTIKEAKPNAQIVGEEYFPVFTKDFAPYLEKVRASGAEVIVHHGLGGRQ